MDDGEVSLCALCGASAPPGVPRCASCARVLRAERERTKSKPWLYAVLLALMIVIVGIVISVRLEIDLGQREGAANTKRLISDGEQAVAALERAAGMQRRPTTRVQRVDVIDGQCAGKGLPRYGFIYDGNTFGQNGYVAKLDGCDPFTDPPTPNITNFFCCPSDAMPSWVSAGSK